MTTPSAPAQKVKNARYLAVLVDLFSRRVVGWAVSERIDTALTLQALERTLESRLPRRG